MNHLSRRGFLKGLAVATGAAAGARLGNRVWMPEARAEEAPGEKSALVAIFLDGGYNSLFSSAGSYRNTAFSVNDSNVSDLGNGLIVGLLLVVRQHAVHACLIPPSREP